MLHARKKKLTVCVSVCPGVRLILVLVWKNCLGFSVGYVYGQSTVYLCLSKYIPVVFENTHTHIDTIVASETEGVAAVSCMESHMNRGPLGSIDPNSIRETALHTECRRSRESTARSMTETGMLLVRGLPLRAGRRQMRHGRKGCGRTDEEKLRGASRRQHKRERRGVCVYPSWAVSMPLCIRPVRLG